eukprot:gene6094-6797_t
MAPSINCTLSSMFLNRHRWRKAKYCINRAGHCVDQSCSCCQCDANDKIYDEQIEECTSKSKDTTPRPVYISTTYTTLNDKTKTPLPITSNTTVTPVIFPRGSESKNPTAIIIGVVVALCAILALIFLVFLWKRRTRERKKKQFCRDTLQLKEVAPGEQAEPDQYEQINKFDIESPAYACVEANPIGNGQGIITTTTTTTTNVPSSPPYSYVDSDKINSIIKEQRGKNNGAPSSELSPQSPVYFTLEEDDIKYASPADVIIANPPENTQSNNAEPYYREVEVDSNEGGYVEPVIVTDTEKYKELTKTNIQADREKNPYQPLILDDIQI